MTARDENRINTSKQYTHNGIPVMHHSGEFYFRNDNVLFCVSGIAVTDVLYVGLWMKIPSYKYQIGY